jgi:hypothetical protein
LQWANLQEADLREADLRGADLQALMVIGTSSIWAQLRRNLRGCYEGVPEVIVCACASGNDVTGSHRIWRHRKWKGDNLSHFVTRFSRVFSTGISRRFFPELL